MSHWSPFADPGLAPCDLGPVSEDPALSFPEDMVAEVPAHWTMASVQEFLAASELALPWDAPRDLVAGSIGRIVEENLPHLHEAAYGSWREWVVGMQVRLPDGTVAKVGSRVVKNVAGYDAQKLFIGGMGAFGQILRLTLRVVPRRLVKPMDVELDESPEWIQRVLPSSWDKACGDRMIVGMASTQTVLLRGEQEPERFAGDWARARGVALREQDLRPEEIALLRRAKSLFDPDGRCAPGLLGVV
jgi:FAD/FMN-containing dehydrogenase